MNKCNHAVFYSDYDVRDGCGSGSIFCMDCNKSVSSIQDEVVILERKLIGEQEKTKSMHDVLDKLTRRFRIYPNQAGAAVLITIEEYKQAVDLLSKTEEAQHG